MKGLFETYIDVLEEAISNSQITNPIEKKLQVKFKYGDESSWREGEIYVFGKNHLGNELLRIYQTSGASKTGNNQWKTFRRDKIKDLKVLKTFFFFDKKFDKMRDKFNTSGDKNMTQVYNIAKF